MQIASDRLLQVLSEISAVLRGRQGESWIGDKIAIAGGQIRISCRNSVIANAVFQLYPALQDTGYGLTIEVEGETPQAFPPLFTSHPIPMLNTAEVIQTTRSRWIAKENNILLLQDFLEERGSVSIHSADRDAGYPCLEIQPFLGLNMVLHRSREELIGNPIDAAGFIGAKKREAVEMAIASRGRAKVPYEFRWGETPSTMKVWEMASTAIYQGDEVLVISSNINDHQRRHWIDIAKSQR